VSRTVAPGTGTPSVVRTMPVALAVGVWGCWAEAAREMNRSQPISPALVFRDAKFKAFLSTDEIRPHGTRSLPLGSLCSMHADWFRSFAPFFRSEERAMADKRKDVERASSVSAGFHRVVKETEHRLLNHALSMQL
jgi:hypothetical protein